MEHNILINKACLRRQGFTLLELLISIAIIGILISAGVASYSIAQKKARDSRRMSDMKAIQNAFEQYNAAHDGSYPATCNTIDATYLPAGFPVDPKNYTGADASTTFVYNFSNTHCSDTSYCFCAHLESGIGNENSDPNAALCAFTSLGTERYYCVGNLQ